MSRHPASIWLDQNYNTLPANEWVAADKDGLVEHDHDYGTLYKKLKSRNINLSDVVVTFIPDGAVR